MPETDERQPRQSSDSLWDVTAGFRLRYLAAIISMGIGTLFLLLVPYLLKSALDSLTQPATTIRNVLLPVALMVVGLNLLNGIFTYLRGRWAAQASEGIVQRLRNRLYSHIEKLPAKYFDHADTGDIVQRCSSDVETIRVFMASQVVEIAKVSLLLIVGIPIMFAQDVRMSLISLGSFPILIGFAYFFYQKIRELFVKVDESEARLSTVIQENLTGIRVVRAFAQQEYEHNKFNAANNEFRDLEMNLFRGLALFWSISDVAVLFQLGVVLIAGGYFVIAGELTIGAWVFFWWMVQTIIWPVRQIGRVVADSSRAGVAIGRINAILHEPEESIEPQPVSAVAGDIEINNLTFGYNAEDPVLHDLSLNIKSGETIAILGPPGSGKSTLIKLLLRLYDYETGSIKIGGTEINSINRQAVRNSFGVVLQDPFLYSKSVKDNIVLGRSDAAHYDIEECARAADIHGNIVEFQDGYETVIGERGVTLSGGQRQRLAIARAILKEPTFLILDDSLSAVDTKTESHILEALEKRHGQQTTILIAHRLSSTRLADRIYVFDHGRIVQSGTHEELLNMEGSYQRLWSIQGVLDDEINAVLSGDES
ncbi:MAG: ABC transporter ATP-binding protein [Planctomicrobium sp.]|jgi:ATP-binding cassette, subfamily B, bacterial|nr:ABC transporter ATP-binding protein [Planctomicrobium sp.]